MGTELIMGMEEVTNYLKELEAKNKKLQEKYDNMREVRYSVSEMRQEQVHQLTEENKKLKQERDFFESEFHKTLQHQADDTEHYEKENKKLKDTILRWQEKYDFNICDSEEESD